MSKPARIGTLSIGAAGELLVQYQLLKYGIDSARLTTDSGIDLVMYLPHTSIAMTIQVKSKLDTITGGTGKPTMGMTFPDNCKAQWLAGADLARDLVWLFPINRARELAQQGRADGTRTLYWFTDNSVGRKTRPESDFDEYRLDIVAARLLAQAASES